MNKRSNKILILIPFHQSKGGISNFYKIIRPNLTSDVIYQYRGSRIFPHSEVILKKTFRLLLDYFIFLKHIVFDRVKLVEVSTPFYRKTLKRDSVFLLIAKLFRVKTIVFYHGWDTNYESCFKESLILKKIFLQTDASIVLSSIQKMKLLDFDYKKKIYIETTAFKKELISDINPHIIRNKYTNIQNPIKILFLSRLEKSKGIFELLRAFNKINKLNTFELIIAGDGLAKGNILKLLDELQLKNVTLLGFISGKEKQIVFKESHIYILPSYSEGMPCSVLEAMAMGLPVLTTKVGGLVDFFEEGKNGFFIEKYSSSSIVEKIHDLVNNKELMLEIALHNHRYAKDHFLASEVAKRNIEIFNEVINEE